MHNYCEIQHCVQVVKQSRVGVTFNGLSQLRHCVSKEQFMVGLIRGFGGNLDLANQAKFAKEVRRSYAVRA